MTTLQLNYQTAIADHTLPRASQLPKPADTKLHSIQKLGSNKNAHNVGLAPAYNQAFVRKAIFRVYIITEKTADLKFDS